MKIISDKYEYPNMTIDEIIRMGIALSGDALQVFADSMTEEKYEMQNRIDSLETIIDDIKTIAKRADEI